mgnify:CR=1 FL=1
MEKHQTLKESENKNKTKKLFTELKDLRYFLVQFLEEAMYNGANSQLSFDSTFA